jgi:hypothetical protein
MGIYKRIKNSSSPTLFKYGVIILLCIQLFRNITIGLNILFAFGIGLIIISYQYEKQIITIDNLESQHKLKVKSIEPNVSKLSTYRDIIDFLYSIQDFYNYNPQAYEEMIDNLFSFFYMYEEVKKGVLKIEEYYEIMQSKKSNSIMIYNLPVSKISSRKIVKAQEVLNDVLHKYLCEIEKAYKLSLYTTGFNINRKNIPIGPIAYNNYLQIKEYTYDIN